MVPKENSQNVSRSEHPGPYFSITARAGLVQAGEHCLGSTQWTGRAGTLDQGSLRHMTQAVLFLAKMNVP